ncbi:MAG: HD domain-containing protein [Candidatus Bipolaricaulota bacterium]
MSASKLDQVKEKVAQCARLRALWTASNITAINRMRVNDHGPVHVRIITRLALKLLRYLGEAGVRPGIADHGGSFEDAEVVVFLASALHDIGHAVHRTEHELLSVVLAPPLLDDLLAGVYEEPLRTAVAIETMHAIYSHRREAEPLTVEAGIIKVADALDMEKGRARIPFRVGEPTIHSVSALAIEKVEVKKGTEKPIHIHVRMSNSAGIFQLDSLFKEKLNRSGLGQYIDVSAEIEGEETKIIERYAIG